MAAAHAQQCVFSHDACRNVRKYNFSSYDDNMSLLHVITTHFLPIARFRVGQNVYIAGSSGDILGTSNWNAAVTSWYNEVQYMNATYIKSFP
jgi:hypothetical protein